VDSERILARLAAAGAIVGADADQADIIIVNTCGFIEPAKRESIETILEYAQYKQSGPCQRLFVMGCLAQRYKEDLEVGLPEVDGVFGLHQDEQILAACGLTSTNEGGRFLLTPKHTAYLSISDGCDSRCTYCAIPMIRGQYRERPAEDIVAEAEELVEAGVRELNVIAQDTTAYGMGAQGKMRIHHLLARLADIPALKWIRLLYTHPAHFPEGLVDAYAETPKLCPYVDLPLQHLNDDMLRRMGRGVTKKRCLDLIDSLRSRIPNVAIRTTLIAGFPGETEAQFQELLQCVRKLRFEQLGVFAYSQEEGTPASLFSNQLSDRIKESRVRELMLAQQEIAFAHNALLVGQRMEVVIDKAAQEESLWVGRSSSQAPDVDSVTYVKDEGLEQGTSLEQGRSLEQGTYLEPGQFVEVEVTGVRGYDLVASPVFKQ
jgi:ribosomal protein S12 methylthiotransferase